MARRAKRKNPNPPGRCSFCGAHNLSKEHLFAEWLKEVFPRDHRSTHTHGHIVHAANPLDPPIITTRKRQGHTGSRKLRVACEPCNNEWMGTLEERAKPILLPMMAGRLIVLNSQMQNDLSAWAVKTAMVAEHERPRLPVITVEERRHLRLHDKPPPNWNVLAIPYVGSLWRDLTVYRQNIPLEPAVEGQYKHLPATYAQITILGMGHVVFVVLSSTWDHLSAAFRRYRPNGYYPLWPTIGVDLHWPSPLFFGDDDIAALIGNFVRLFDNIEQAPTDITAAI